MSERDRLRQLPVGQLRQGMYVAEPDRPWTELPTLFQGFEIQSEEDLDVFRTHCATVYIDPERSSGDALEALTDEDISLDSDSAAPMPEERIPPRPEMDSTEAFGSEREPPTEHFERLLRAAYESRSETRRFIESALNEIHAGGQLEPEQGQAAVASLARRVGENPGAAVWLSNLDERDYPTSVHCVNVCILALTFGVHLGMDASELETVGLGALLHDIGKMFMPDEIRDKPGPLTEAEWDVARRHPGDGRDILAEKGGFSQEVLEIVGMHHERLDGNGYPSGLGGVAIPLHVRVVALANHYDALTSDRVYRKAMAADQALQRLYDNASATYGERLVQEFIRCVGIYPPGSLVELDNGAVGVVLGSHPEARLQPTVLLVRSPDGAYYQKRVVVNLAAQPGTGSRGAAQQIRRALNPADEEIDVAGIVAIEFGLDQFAPG